MKRLTLSLIAIAAMTVISGCGVAKTTGKVAALPVKGVYHTGRLAGKGIYNTGKYTGKGVYHTGRYAGKGVVGTAKGVYYVGMVPVKITDRALDTTTKILTVTTQVVDLSGKVVTVSHQISAMELDQELANIKRAKNVVGVTIDAFG